MRFRILGLGFRDWDLGAQGLGLRIKDLDFRV